MLQSRKWIMSLTLLVSMALFFVACNQGPTTRDGGSDAVQLPADTAADAPSGGTSGSDVVTLRLAHNITVGGVDDQAANLLAEKVFEKSGGTLEIKVYAGGQLGNERDMLEGLKMGTIEMGLNTSAYISNLTPEFGMLDVPYMFEDFDDVRSKLFGVAGDFLTDKLVEDHDIRVLSWWNSSFRIMLTNSAAINTIDDLNGRKMRAPEVPVYIDMFNALGATPTPIPFGEVYTSIQTGVVDGVEVCAEEMYAMKFHEVGNYIAVTNHIFSTMVPVISEKVYQELSEEHRQVLAEAVAETTEWQWDHFVEADEHALQEMEVSGITVTYPDRAPFVEACGDMQQKYADEYQAGELLELLIG